MPVVAAEQLVTRIARQRDGDVPARQLRHKMGRDLRGIGERLVVNPRQLRHHLHRGPRINIELGMIGAEMLRDFARVLGLVVTALGKADAEGANGLARLRLHQRHDGRGVDAAGQEGAERHIRQALPLHRRRQQLLQPRDRLAFAADPITLGGDDGITQRPIGLRGGRRPRSSVGDEGNERSGWQFAHVAPDGSRRRHVRIAHEIGERGPI